MVEAEQQRPYTEAFNAWFASAVDLHDIMAFERCEDRDAMEINFLTGGGALHGYAHNGGISIAAVWDGECWDFLFDEDVVAEHTTDGWHCSLCPADQRAFFSSVEALWTDHLFQPLWRWITMQLLRAKGVGFYGGGGMTWAKLVAYDVEDQPVRLVLFNP